MEPDPFALPCHPHLRIESGDRDWRKIGVKGDAGVLRKSTTCPECKTTYSAYQRSYEQADTVEWIRSKPFRVTAVPLGANLPMWQDDEDRPATPAALPDHERQQEARTEMQQATGAFEEWRRSTQLCSPVQTLTAEGHVYAEPGDLLLERFLPWNATNRRMTLLWSPRLERQVVTWHSFARLRET